VSSAAHSSSSSSRYSAERPRARTNAHSRIGSGAANSAVPADHQSEHHAELEALFADLPERTPLSRAALETAAAIALQQPATAAEVQTTRGVQNSDTIRTLLKRKLIAPAGRAGTRGHPLRYRTTERFFAGIWLGKLRGTPLRLRASPSTDAFARGANPDKPF
jgi:hypothetical protein